VYTSGLVGVPSNVPPPAEAIVAVPAAPAVPLSPPPLTRNRVGPPVDGGGVVGGGFGGGGGLVLVVPYTSISHSEYPQPVARWVPFIRTNRPKPLSTMLSVPPSPVVVP
jgi:hypothetical protein